MVGIKCHDGGVSTRKGLVWQWFQRVRVHHGGRHGSKRRIGAKSRKQRAHNFNSKHKAKCKVEIGQGFMNSTPSPPTYNSLHSAKLYLQSLSKQQHQRRARYLKIMGNFSHSNTTLTAKVYVLFFTS